MRPDRSQPTPQPARHRHPARPSYALPPSQALPPSPPARQPPSARHPRFAPHPRPRLVPTLGSLALVAWAAIAGAACDVSPRVRFDRDVVPLIERSCAGSTCHTAQIGEAIPDSMRDVFVVNAAGHLVDRDAAYATALQLIDATAPPIASTLLRKPLAVGWGGVPHRGGAQIASPDDDAFRLLADWIDSEPAGGEDPPPLSALEQQFAQTVEPALLSLTCASGGCHGVDAAVPFRLDPGAGGERWTRSTRNNYDESLRMLALDGVPESSRLLRKALPLHAGGIVHKGGNDRFLVSLDDPRALAIADWACAERLDRTGQACADGPVERALVWTRGPLGPEDAFDLDVFAPGSDLLRATLRPDGSLGPETSLTEALHASPADLRDPAVSPDGRSLVFAMRAAPDLGHALMWMDLETGQARALTAPGVLPDGRPASDRDPSFGPDGEIWFVSNRAGLVAERGDRLDADLYRVDPVSGVVTRESWTPHIERGPIYLRYGTENGGEIAFTALRDAVPSAARAHPFRFPPGLETEYHQHFGITPPETRFLGLTELPDGRYLTAVGELDDAWEGGILGVIDRNFGPELPPVGRPASPSLPFYADPLARLDLGGLIRDPVATPEGDVLLAWDPDLGDPTDADASARFVLARVALAERVDGGGPEVASATALTDPPPGLSDRQPRLVLVRDPGPPGSVRAEVVAPGRAQFLHNGLPLIDALLGHLPPSGAKPIRDDIVGVRLVEPLALGPSRRAPLPPDANGDRRGSTATLSDRIPTRVLAELPLAADGSFAVDLPAGTAVRVQALDARGMVVGTPHNRWFDLHEGQLLRQGAGHQDPGFYTARCAPCHGALDGDPEGVFVAPDVMTTATLTLSRFEGGNPRRPLPLTVVGEGTRREIDFEADIEPLLVRSCVQGCHQGAEPSGGLALDAEDTEHFTVAYESLLVGGSGSLGGRRYVDDDGGRARGSWLAEVLLGEELDAPGIAPLSPHDGEPPLTADEVATLLRWIELGASYVGREDAP